MLTKTEDPSNFIDTFITFFLYLFIHFYIYKKFSYSFLLSDIYILSKEGI